MSQWIAIIVAVANVALLPLALRADEPKEKMASNNTAFATDLYAQLATHQGNQFFSPASLETALAMTYAGARKTTAEQMEKSLHFTGSADEVNAAFGALLKTLTNPPEVFFSVDSEGKAISKPAYQLVVANALWGQQAYPFEPGFTQVIEKNYGAGLHAVDYRQTEQGRMTINAWVASQTQDKVKELIAKRILTADTRLVLTNAIYFKSNWHTKFSKANTKDGPFHLSADESLDAPLMHQKHVFQYLENNDLQLLELPYTQGELSMIVLLPRHVAGLPLVEQSLTAENLRQWFNDARPESVEVTLPKFTFSSELQLADTLQAMGMTAAFDPDEADFSGMSSAERLFISAVIQKAFIAIDEEGTEAAAATALPIFGGSAFHKPKEPKVFKADHPFLFLIRHNATGEILFMGRLSNPASQ